jgi:hypothetical protein
MQARQQFRDDWASEREYLTLAFFDLWMGRGLLEEFSVRTSVMMSASPAARAMRMQLHLTPVPGVLAAHPAAGGLSHWAAPIYVYKVQKNRDISSVALIGRNQLVSVQNWWE